MISWHPYCFHQAVLYLEILELSTSECYSWVLISLRIQDVPNLLQMHIISWNPELTFRKSRVLQEQ